MPEKSHVGTYPCRECVCICVRACVHVSEGPVITGEWAGLEKCHVEGLKFHIESHTYSTVKQVGVSVPVTVWDLHALLIQRDFSHRYANS